MASGPAPSVVLAQGTVVGITQRDLYPTPLDCFLGIPYALPPVGERRYRPAEKVPSSSSKIIDATKIGASAPGKPSILYTGPAENYSEDCLRVNVYRQQPKKNEEGKKSPPLLPVCVYVHGGAFNRGSAAMHNTASMLGWSELPFIAVSFNYRLGSLGFLPSSLSSKEGILNLGLRDQIVLFEWVRDNISQFGGNPMDVTLMGFSAGAHSIGYHLLRSTGSEAPLFHRAILQSGSPTARTIHHYAAAIHESQFKEFLFEAGVPIQLPEREIFHFLREQALSVIIKAQDAIWDRYNKELLWPFQPVIDGDIIARHPVQILQSDEWRRIPIMLGFNTNEGSMFVDKSLSQEAEFEAFFKRLLPGLSRASLRELSTIYPDKTPTTAQELTKPHLALPPGVGRQYRRIEQAYGHYAYTSPIRQMAYFSFSNMKRSNKPLVSVYLYHWALSTSTVEGASHGNNLNYHTYDEKVCSISNQQRELAGFMHAYITSFICTGDPNTVSGRHSHRPGWRLYGTNGDTDGDRGVLILGEGNTERIGGNEIGSLAKMSSEISGEIECEYWWQQSCAMNEGNLE